MATTKRRVFVIGLALGQTSVFFYDEDNRQVGALDVNVNNKEVPPAPVELSSGAPVNEVVVYRGPRENFVYLSCTPTKCLTNPVPPKDTEQPPSIPGPTTPPAASNP